MKLQELFTQRKTWAKGWFAYDSQHRRCPARNPEAVCWCLRGGLEFIYSSQNSHYDKIVDYLERRFPTRLPPKSPGGEYYCDPISRFNDHVQTKFEDIQTLVKDLNI